MSKEELESRVLTLESAVEACMAVVNKLLEDMYQPGRIKKLDKLANYGKEGK